MEKNNLVKEILKKVFPIEYDAVGTSLVNEIVMNDVEFESPTGGQNLDLQALLVLLATASTLIKNVIDIYQKIKDKKEAAPKLKEIQNEINILNIDVSVIEQERVELLYVFSLETLNDIYEVDRFLE